MKKLWNRQHKLNKFIAFCLALMLVVVPLMTYVGDKEGAKAETGNPAIPEYHITLSEDVPDGNVGLGLPMDANSSDQYYMQFKSDGSYARETINYYTDEIRFDVKAELTSRAHKYGSSSLAAFDTNNYKIAYVGLTTDNPKKNVENVESASTITTSNGYVTVSSDSQYPYGIAVYIQPKITNTQVPPATAQLYTVEELQSKTGYTLIGVYKFSKKTLNPTWTGKRRGYTTSGEAVKANKFYSSATLSAGSGIASDSAGKIKYKYICSESAPDTNAIKASEGWFETPITLGSNNTSGTYYGYVGYFTTDASGNESLVTYGATATPVKLDTDAPVVTKFNVKYQDINGEYKDITSDELDENGVFWGKKIGAFQSIKIDIEAQDDGFNSNAEIAVTNTRLITCYPEYEGNKVKYNPNPVVYMPDNNTLIVTITDEAGNSTDATFQIDGSDVTFRYGNTNYTEISSVGIVGTTDDYKEDMSGNSAASVTYVNKNWLDTHGAPSFVLEIKSDEKYDKGDASYLYKYELNLDATAQTQTYERPYYYTTVNQNLGTANKTYAGIELKYKNLADNSDVMKSYGTVICDYDAPEIRAAKLQRTNSSGTWEDVPAADIENNQYYINPNETTQYRFYVDAADVGDSGLADAGVVCNNALYSFVKSTVSGESGYVCNINPATLPETITAATPVSVTIADKAGNVSEAKSLPTLIKQLGATTIKPVLYDNGNPVDLSVATQYITKNGLKLKVEATSGVDITDISFAANVNGVPTTFPASASTNTHTMDSKVKVYKATYEFTVPANLDLNSLIENGKITVKTTDSSYNKDFDLRTILYDSTTPVFKVAVGSSACYLNQVDVGWQQNYTLNYTILSGEDANVESAIASAAYTVDNTKPENVKTDEAIATNNTATITGSIEIPESATIAGTRVAITATDAAGNAALSGANQQVYIKVDKTKPSIGDIAITGYTVYSTPIAGYPTVSAVISDNLTLQSAEMKITYPNGEVKTTMLSAKEQTNLREAISYQLAAGAPDGDYRVEIHAKDMAGNEAVTKVQTFKLDNTKPVVTAAITSGTVGGKAPRADGTDVYYRSDVGVKFTYDDENIKSVTVTDNDSPVKVNWKEAAGTINVSGEGRHVIKINAVDISGNSAEEKRVEFIIDKSAPAISLALNGLPYLESRGVVDFTGNATVNVTVSDMTVDADDFHYQMVITRPDQAANTSAYLQTQNRSFTFSDEGDYTLNFYTLDMANNQSATRSVSFQIDKTAPEVSISGITAGGTSADAASVRFSLKEAFWRDASGVITIYRKAGDGNEETLYKTINVTPTAYETVTTESLTETGVYRMEFTATDRVGHKSSTSQTFTIDREAPVVALAGVKNYDVTDKAVEFKAEISDDFYGSKTVSIEGTRTDINGKKNALSFSPFNQHGNPTVISESYADDGIYDITVTAIDAAGNKHSNTVHFTIDKTAPVITGLDDLDGKILTAVDLDFDLDEMVSDLTVCKAHMYLNGSEYDGVSDIEDGSYTLLITAEDELGHYSEKSVSFVLDTKPPVFIVTGVEDGEVKEADYSIDVSLQLDEDTLTEVTLNGKSVDISEDAAHIDVTKEGSYTLYMKAVDAAGNEAEQNIEFKYGKDVNVLLIVIISIAAVLLVGGVTGFVIAKKKKK